MNESAIIPVIEMEVKNKVDQNLVVLDGSASAQKAAKIAVEIAKVERQKILGLYIVDETLVLDTYANYHKELGRNDWPDSRAELIDWFDAVGDITLNQLEQMCQQSNVPVETQILFGGVPELILDHAAKSQMLTIGRRGRGHASNPGHLGKNFRHIAHHTRIPLLVGGNSKAPIKNLFLFGDGNPHFEKAIAWTARLQNDLGTKVNVTVIDLIDSNLIWQDIQEQISQQGLINYHHWPLQQSNLQDALGSTISTSDSLLVMGGYRHPEIMEWLARGKIDLILRNSDIPVLIT